MTQMTLCVIAGNNYIHNFSLGQTNHCKTVQI